MGPKELPEPVGELTAGASSRLPDGEAKICSRLSMYLRRQKRHIKDWHIQKYPSDPGSSKNRSKPVGNHAWEVALRPGTAGKTSNPIFGKYSFMFAWFSGP